MTTYLDPARVPPQGPGQDPHRSLHSETGARPGEHPGRSRNPLVKAAGLAWLEFEKPDLDGAERFGTDFGFTVADRTPETLLLRGLERDPGETGLRTAADHHARGSRVPAAQQQRLRRPVGHGEAEVGAEPPGAVQVRLLELQPGQPGHLDQGILGPPGVLPGPRPGLAVQRTVRVFPGSRGRHSGRVQMGRHDRIPHSR